MASAFKDVVHEAVHDCHCLGRDASVGMDLLQDFVDVDGVKLLPPALLFLVAFRDVLLGLAGLLRSFSANLRRYRSERLERVHWHLSVMSTVSESELYIRSLCSRSTLP